MSEPSHVALNLGINRLFGTRDIGSSGLVSGWSLPEEAHTWNDGLEAVINLSISTVRQPCRLIFEGEPFLGEECPRQDVHVYVNGFRLGYWRLTESRTYEMSVIIEPEQLFQRQRHTIARCVWHLPNSIRPADIGTGSDSRELGFCFRSITLAGLD